MNLKVLHTKCDRLELKTTMCTMDGIEFLMNEELDHEWGVFKYRIEFLIFRKSYEF